MVHCVHCTHCTHYTVLFDSYLSDKGSELFVERVVAAYGNPVAGESGAGRAPLLFRGHLSTAQRVVGLFYRTRCTWTNRLFIGVYRLFRCVKGLLEVFNGSFIGVNKLFYGCSYGCVPTFLPHALHMDKRQCGHSNAPVKWTTLLLEAPISITSGEPSSKVHWINKIGCLEGKWVV